MKTLYVSDLDGTLLQPDAKLSACSIEMLNRAIADGKLFTVATARTPATVAPILSDVELNLPAIVMTGAALWNAATGQYSRKVLIDNAAADRLVALYRATGTSSFIYTLRDNMLDIRFVGEHLNDLQRDFIEARVGNPFKRLHVRGDNIEPLPLHIEDMILAYTMLPDGHAYAVYQQMQHLAGIRPQYYHDYYGPEVGILEAFSPEATKAKAMRALAAQLGADRIVAFGDNINDLPMMAEADVAVAVENALPEVKDAADIVIGPNTADSVAKFILID